MLNLHQQIYNHLKGAKRIVIVPHQNPDGDALGSATALFEFFKQINKPVEIFCSTPIPSRLNFLPHSHHINNSPAIFNNLEVDTVIVLDSGDLRYAGVDRHLKDHSHVIINIDHHPTNEHYGHYNLVVPTASSTSEVLFRFFGSINFPLNHRAATSLLTGIITDTDNFTNAAASSDSLAAAGSLIRYGANLNLINSKTIKNKTINTLKLWGLVLSRLKRHDELDLAYTYIKQKDLEKNNVSETESEGIANFLNNLDNTKIALILKETKEGKIKGSFRTTKDNVDVTTLAKKFGGGGHKKAAGFTVEGTIEEVLKKILQD